MSKEGVIYVSGMKKKTEYIFRGFCAKNGLTLSQGMDLVVHLMVSYGIEKLIDGTNEEFEALDAKMREILQQFPEEYRKRPIVQRWFGKVVLPLTRKEVELIEKRIAEEEAEGKTDPDVPEVDTNEMD